MAETKAEILGNEIVNYIRHNTRGMVADGWRDADSAAMYKEELQLTYDDPTKTIRSEFYVASDKVPTVRYKEACKELGLEPRQAETVEYKIVLFPFGGGVWDITVWVRDHADVDHWYRKEDASGEEEVQFFTSTRSRHAGRPLAQWELMGARRLEEATPAYIAEQEINMKLILDALMARVNQTATINMEQLAVDRAKGLYTTA
ncbi:MAG: hypothetical protein CMQ35_08025 [Gammaproteobacteria bacterium]|jgi:hypothetical protein|nr:hypothetical protein [Gammaproteobacteria bacterium]|tara:strand:- start:640 stop:1248 length:609 start_codon:yes stop_codon:yes gene_type:complete